LLPVELGDHGRQAAAGEVLELLGGDEALGVAVLAELLEGVLDVLFDDLVAALDGLGLLRGECQREGEQQVHGLDLHWLRGDTIYQTCKRRQWRGQGRGAPGPGEPGGRPEPGGRGASLPATGGGPALPPGPGGASLPPPGPPSS